VKVKILSVIIADEAQGFNIRIEIPLNPPLPKGETGKARGKRESKRGVTPLFNFSPSPRMERGTQGVMRLIKDRFDFQL
jgi:hypothetical protein